jgi:hypothetical protein
MFRRILLGLTALTLSLVACATQPGGSQDSPLKSPIDAPRSGDLERTDELVDALRGVDATVETGGQAEQPFFSVPGRIVLVNGQQLQVFEYGTAADRGEESALISPEGFTVGTYNISWVQQPHFWAVGRLIVLYVGEDEALLELLTPLLGEPITQASDRPSPDPPSAADAAQRHLGELLDIPVNRIDLLYFERVSWRNGCLELGEPGEMCTQAITPGWRVVLAANGMQYEYHTDLSGQVVRLKQPPTME